MTIHAQLDDALAAAMMRTAKAERRAAAKRDGMRPGAMPQCARHGLSGPQPTKAGQEARDLYAANPDLTSAELADLAGIARSTARDIIRKAKGHVAAAGRRTTAGQEAERLLREGALRHCEIVARTGLSRSSVKRLAAAIRRERGTA